MQIDNESLKAENHLRTFLERESHSKGDFQSVIEVGNKAILSPFFSLKASKQAAVMKEIRSEIPIIGNRP